MDYDQIVSLIRKNFPELEPGREGKQLSFWVPWLPRKEGRVVRVKKNGALKRVASYEQAKREHVDTSAFDRVFRGTEADLLRWIAGEIEILHSRAPFEVREAGVLSPRIESVAALADAAAGSVSFDPADHREGKVFVARSIASRSGQPGFRRDLIAAYGEACLISSCAIGRLVEAAHIVPFDGAATNVRSNGLLLRSDLHTLFDLGLLRITPRTHCVVLHPTLLSDPTYGRFADQKLTMLDGVVSDKALAHKFDEITW